MTLVSCQKETLPKPESINGPVISDDATVAEKVDLMKAGLYPYPAKYSDSALRKKYGTIQGLILFNGNSYMENMVWANWELNWSSYKVINRGLGGTTWNEQVGSIPKLVTDYKAKIIILYSGENELLRGYDKTTVTTGFNKFYDSTRKYNPNATIIVTSMLTCPALYGRGRAADVDTINTYYKSKVSKDSKAIFHDIRSIVIRTDSTNWKSDYIHPTPSAYLKWWGNLKPILNSLLVTN